MKNLTLQLIASAVLFSLSALAQSVDVKPTGVEIGATATGASGALIKQEGSVVSIWNKNGPNPAELKVVVAASGNVGIGTSAVPTEKLEVAGNVKINSAVLAPTGNAPIFGCRAWVNFDGTRNAAGVVDPSLTARFIRGAGNVSSVIKNDTGDYTINFTIPMPDANYAFSITSSVTGVFNGSWQSLLQMQTKNASSIRLQSAGDHPHGSVNDKEEVSLTIFR